MRRQSMVLAAGVLVVVAAAAAACVALRSPARHAGPDQVAHAYFAAWQGGDFTAMRRLVDDPPSDFADRHRRFSRDLGVLGIALTPGPLVRQGDRASADYGVTRDLAHAGRWSFHATLRLARRRGRWRVEWSPATLYPALAEGGDLRLERLDAAPSEAVARDGKVLPADSGAQPYLTQAADSYGEGGDPGWAVVLRNPGRPPRRLKVSGGGGATPARTTLDRRIQAAADRAVRSETAALVAVRPSTGDVLAVADRLPEPMGAFTRMAPPGSTFKVVVAAALLGEGMTPGTSVSCPAVAVAAQRTIHNDGDFALGSVPLGRAFAESCNTTFARLGVAAGARRIGRAATSFGFGTRFDPGEAAYSGDFPATASGNALAEAAIGQGTVQATTLDMAVVAAAVADGTFRPPRFVAGHGGGGRARPLPSGAVAGLRAMMREVVAHGTATRAGLPPGTAGKTGTAENPDGRPHAWFIGYRGDLAFAVFAEHGGEGGRAAAPIAARFLRDS